MGKQFRFLVLICREFIYTKCLISSGSGHKLFRLYNIKPVQVSLLYLNYLSAIFFPYIVYSILLFLFCSVPIYSILFYCILHRQVLGRYRSPVYPRSLRGESSVPSAEAGQGGGGGVCEPALLTLGSTTPTWERTSTLS